MKPITIRYVTNEAFLEQDLNPTSSMFRSDLGH